MASPPGNDLQLLQDAAANEAREFGFPGITVHVDLGRTNIRGTVAVGMADPQAGLKLTGKEPGRIASMTKTYTAAVILRLVEMERVALDHGISEYLTHETVSLLQSGGYNTSEMTVRHLLQHNSGLPEHADEAFKDFVIANPQHEWTGREEVQWALDHSKPIGSPGEKFTYSDTGYVLLGEMIEQQAKLPMAEAFRTILRYDDLGLRHTWFEKLEPAPNDLPPMVHQFLEELDTANIDPSFDLWGGGGIVATAEDAGDFLRALMTGKVFERDSTLPTMLSIPSTNGELGYGLGIFRITVPSGGDNEGEMEFWGHTGHFGTAFWYCPKQGITYVSARQQANKPEGHDPHALVSTAVRIYLQAQNPAK